MKKVNVRRNLNLDAYLEYDENEYDIECIKDEDYIIHHSYFILKRLSDNKVLKVFDGEVASIIQCKNNHFIEIDETITKGGTHTEVYDYIDVGEPSLINISKHNCVDYTRVRDDIFILDKKDSTKCVYTTGKVSKDFNEIYDDSSIIKIIGKDSLLVEEVRTSRWKYVPKMHDRITYAIDINTFEIKTPIWSDMQQRFIPLLSEEELKEKEELYRKKGVYPTFSLINLDDKRIMMDVQIPLDEVARHQECGPAVYENGKVNKEFVKKFSNKKNKS